MARLRAPAPARRGGHGTTLLVSIWGLAALVAGAWYCWGAGNLFPQPLPPFRGDQPQQTRSATDTAGAILDAASDATRSAAGNVVMWEPVQRRLMHTFVEHAGKLAWAAALGAMAAGAGAISKRRQRDGELWRPLDHVDRGLYNDTDRVQQAVRCVNEQVSEAVDSASEAARQQMLVARYDARRAVEQASNQARELATEAAEIMKDAAENPKPAIRAVAELVLGEFSGGGGGGRGRSGGGGSGSGGGGGSRSPSPAASEIGSEPEDQEPSSPAGSGRFNDRADNMVPRALPWKKDGTPFAGDFSAVESGAKEGAPTSVERPRVVLPLEAEMAEKQPLSLAGQQLLAARRSLDRRQPVAEVTLRAPVRDDCGQPAPRTAPQTPRRPETGSLAGDSSRRAQTPSSASGSKAKVAISMTVRNMDFALLTADPALEAAFVAAAKRTISREAGAGVLPENVTVALSSGSVVIQATITPPIGADASAVQEALRSPERLGRGLATRLERIEGLQAVCTGRIAVSDISDPIKFLHKAKSEATPDPLRPGGSRSGSRRAVIEADESGPGLARVDLASLTTDWSRQTSRQSSCVDLRAAAEASAPTPAQIRDALNTSSLREAFHTKAAQSMAARSSLARASLAPPFSPSSPSPTRPQQETFASAAAPPRLMLRKGSSSAGPTPRTSVASTASASSSLTSFNGMSPYAAAAATPRLTPRLVGSPQASPSPPRPVSASFTPRGQTYDHVKSPTLTKVAMHGQLTASKRAATTIAAPSSMFSPPPASPRFMAVTPPVPGSGKLFIDPFGHGGSQTALPQSPRGQESCLASRESRCSRCLMQVSKTMNGRCPRCHRERQAMAGGVRMTM